MKILIICHEHPPLGGGGGSAASRFAMNLAGQGDEVLFVTSTYKDMPLREQTDGYGVFRFDISRKNKFGCDIPELIRFGLRGKRFIDELFKDYRPDAIAAFFAIPSGYVARYASQKYKIPYIVSLRGGDVPGFLSRELWFYQFLATPLLKKIMGSAKRVFSNSRYLARLGEKTSKSEIAVVPNGFDTELYKPDFSKRPGGLVNILFAGRLVYQKGLDVALKAVSILDKTRFHLNIVGSGPLEGELKALAARLNLAGSTTFMGWLTKSELLKLYQQSHILVIPSRDEGLPNVVTEAMSCSMAVVGTNCGGIPELVENGVNGYVVEPDDIKAFSEKLGGLISDTDTINKFCENSREMAGRWSWADSANRLRGLINEH